nr:unnamed protein product [Digitaria exilis]
MVMPPRSSSSGMQSIRRELQRRRAKPLAPKSSVPISLCRRPRDATAAAPGSAFLALRCHLSLHAFVAVPLRPILGWVRLQSQH